MSKNTSFTLGNHFDSFINAQIEAGRYATSSELMRAALRLLEEKEAKLTALRQMLTDGENSSHVDYSFEGLLAELDTEAD